MTDLGAASVEAAVRAGGADRAAVYLDEAPSTQDAAFTLAAAGAPDGSVVVAERQTAGRGRLGRRWESAPGLGLWFSRVVRPRPPVPPVPLVVAATAVAVAEAVEAEAGVPVELRWPNDLLVGGRKVAGILLEARDLDPAAPLLVLGVGIDVGHGEADFPPAVRGEATSLALASGRRLDRGALLAAVLGALDGRLRESRDRAGREALDRVYAARAAFVGRAVTLLDGDTRREGLLREASPLRGLLLGPHGGGPEVRVRPEHARELRVDPRPRIG